MSLLFLALLAVTIVVAIQIVGVLLVFSLLVAPAAAAHALTSRPLRSVALAMGIALISAWAGLLAGVWLGGPVSFWITAIASLAYLGARIADAARPRLLRRAVA